MTLNDLEQRNSPYFAFFHWIRELCRPNRQGEFSSLDRVCIPCSAVKRRGWALRSRQDRDLRFFFETRPRPSQISTTLRHSKTASRDRDFRPGNGPRKCNVSEIWLITGQIFASDKGHFTLTPSVGVIICNIWINFTSPETWMIVLPDAEDRTIVPSFVWTNTRMWRTDRQTYLLWLLQWFALQAMWTHCKIYCVLFPWPSQAGIVLLNNAFNKYQLCNQRSPMLMGMN